jgi:hypothetical protein
MKQPVDVHSFKFIFVRIFRHLHRSQAITGFGEERCRAASWYFSGTNFQSDLRILQGTPLKFSFEGTVLYEVLCVRENQKLCC